MPQTTSDIKTTQIQIRVTQREKAALKRQAKKLNVSVSDLIRAAILDNPERRANNEANTTT